MKTSPTAHVNVDILCHYETDENQKEGSHDNNRILNGALGSEHTTFDACFKMVCSAHLKNSVFFSTYPLRTLVGAQDH